MKRFRWPRTPAQWRSVALSTALLTLLLIVLSPELRALLFVIEIVGVDVYLLLCLAQLRSYAPMIGPIGLALVGQALAWMTRLASAAGSIGHAMVPREGVWIAGSALMATCVAMTLVIAGTNRPTTTLAT